MYYVEADLTIAVEKALAPVVVHMMCSSQEEHRQGQHNPRSLHSLCQQHGLPKRSHHYVKDIEMVTCRECRSWTSTEARTRYIWELIHRLRRTAIENDDDE